MVIQQIEYCKNIKTIVRQHKDIIDVANEILEIASSRNINTASDIKSNLDIFRTKLEEHIELESVDFYEKLLKYLLDNGESASSIKEMQKNANHMYDIIYQFLGKYNTVDNIVTDIDNFAIAFGKVFGVLIVRIEMEETNKYFEKCLNK